MSNDTMDREPGTIDMPGTQQSEPQTLAQRPQSARVQVMPPPDEPRGSTQHAERVIVRHSPEIAELVGALAEAQGEFGDVERTLEAKVESRRTGTNYAFQYETLKDVIGATRGPLSKHGLAMMQFPFPGQNTITLRTMLAHKSGQWIYNDLTVNLEGGLNPQSVGSGISYLMRYSRKAILGISAGFDDDDGQAAARGPVKPGQRKSQQPAAQSTESSDKPAAKAPAKSTAKPATESAKESSSKSSTHAAGAQFTVVGKIVEMGESGGATFVKLDTDDFICATRDQSIAEGCKNAKAGNRRVELTCKQPNNTGGQKFAPTLLGCALV